MVKIKWTQIRTSLSKSSNNNEKTKRIERNRRSCRAAIGDVWRQNKIKKNNAISLLLLAVFALTSSHAHIHTHSHSCMYMCACVCKCSVGPRMSVSSKWFENNICVVVSFLNGSIQDLSIRHATFLISNSYVRYVNKLLRIFAHTHTSMYVPLCARTSMYMHMATYIEQYVHMFE